MQNEKQARKLMSIAAMAVAVTVVNAITASSAPAALVLHMPLNDASSGGVTTALAPINDATHPTTFGTSIGTGDAWFNDATRGNVYSSSQGNRLIAGTQGIDRAVGFTWSIWVKVDATAAGNADAGADVLIGTRSAVSGVWHKVQATVTDNWTGINYAASNVANNTWRHIAYLGDSTSVRMYIDGALVGTDATTPTSTFTGNFEIGGSAQFTEDSEGLFSDVGVWNEALTANEVKGLFDVSKASPGLLYDVAEFDLLKQIHDAAGGSVTIGSRTWYYVTGLTDPAGLTAVGSDYNLVLNAANGTGLTTILVPAPAALPVGLAMLALAALRRRRR